MTFNSSTKAGADFVTAANNNDQRLDDLTHAGDTLTDSGTANNYVVTVDDQITTLEVGQVVKMIVGNTNTGASTLRFKNSLALDTTVAIKRRDGTDLKPRDLIAGEPAYLVKATTYFYINHGDTGDHKFGGTGADGALDTSGGTVNIDLGGANVVVKNYTSINVATNDLTFSNPAADGTTIFLKSQGNVTISAEIDASGMGAEEGSASYLQLTSTDHAPTDGTTGTNNSETDGSNPVGGSTLDFGEKIWLTNSSDKLHRRSIIFSHLCGQGSATAGNAGTDGLSGGPTGGTGGAAGASGNNGPLLVIECGGALDFSGTVNVAGANGANGSNGGDGDGPSTVGDGAAGGGGGGGAGAGGNGGYAIILYNVLTANTGTINSAGGTGGTGGNGGTGGEGNAASSWDGQGGGGGGAGAAASGTYSAAGATSVGGQGGGVANTVDGRGGRGGAGGSGGAGGGTFFGGAGSAGSQGAQATSPSSTAGTTGGAGGAGGAGAASIGGLVAFNQWFA